MLLPRPPRRPNERRKLTFRLDEKSRDPQTSILANDLSSKGWIRFADCSDRQTQTACRWGGPYVCALALPLNLHDRGNDHRVFQVRLVRQGGKDALEDLRPHASRESAGTPCSSCRTAPADCAADCLCARSTTPPPRTADCFFRYVQGRSAHPDNLSLPAPTGRPSKHRDPSKA